MVRFFSSFSEFFFIWYVDVILFGVFECFFNKDCLSINKLPN